MRRKSERVKDKDKTEKKPDKSSKKSRTRSSRRRKKSSSTSPESSEAEDIDSVHNSHDDTEEEQSSGRSRREKPKVVYAEDDADIGVVVEAANDEKGTNSRTRRASKKQLAESADEQSKPDLGEESTVSVAEVKGETSDPKHKEKEGKSSLWQVKSADCSSGEIKKLKLCIVRPPEPELSPRKRKKLNRLSHRDVADGESEENTARDSSGERRKSRRSLRNASASDDSMSPDKFKGHGSSRGKHKSGDSSEEGHRTQDSSEEMTAIVVDVSVDKHDSTKDEVVVSAAVDNTLEEVHETAGSPDGNSEIRNPREDQPQSPAEEEFAESSNSPVSRETPVEPVDPFDQLKAEGTKPLSKDPAAVVSGKPMLEELVVGSCDSTEEPRSGALVKKTQQVAAVVEEIPHVSDLFVQKSEVCDSSVDLQKEERAARILSEDKPKDRRISSEEKSETRGSSKERTTVHDSAEKKPQGRGVSEEIPGSQESSEERRTVRDSSEEKPKVSDTSKKIPKSRDSSEERRAARDLSKKRHKSHDSSEDRTPVVDSSERLKVSDPLKHTTKTSVSSEDKPKEQNLLQEEPAQEKMKGEEKCPLQRSPRTSADEPKHRSRRLIRTSVGDRHKHISPQKSDVEVLSAKSKEDKEATSNKSRDEKDISISVKDEVSSTKTRAERDASPKKSREEKAVSSESKKPRESSHRTRIVWDEKPATESRRHRIVQESVPPSDSSREHSAKHSPSKLEEVKDVSTRVHIPEVKVKVNSAAEIAPPKRHEKITLKRSFSTKTAVIDAQGNGESSDKDQQQISEKEDAMSVRKRRWGGSKTSTTGVKPVLSISSDSLKTLIPEAKPLEISEVELTPEEEEKEEGEVEGATSEIEPEEEREEEENEAVVPPPREPEPVREVKLIFPPGASTNVPLPDEHRDKGARKISLVTDDMRALSPARHRVSNVLYVTNLVRPFTVNQLRELLARTGAIAEDGFWIDAIKSRCYVKYATEQEAQETRHALHGVRWPVSNPKQLCVDYGRPEDLAAALTVGQPPPQPLRKTQPLRVDGSGAWPSDLDREKERVRLAREKEKIERERVRDRDADRERNLKMAGSIREWDLGKTEGGAFEDGRQSREERGGEKERRLRKDRNYRSPSPRDVPARKIKKKEEDAPAKLLDDLFRKTKLTPCIYWLPLTADQIVVKEEMRRKHMAEHERRMAEIRKVEKERLSRMQGGRPPPRRYVDNNKRRRHSPSGSPKK